MKSWILKRESHKCGNDLCRKKHQQKNFEELFLNVQMKCCRAVHLILSPSSQSVLHLTEMESQRSLLGRQRAIGLHLGKYLSFRHIRCPVSLWLTNTSVRVFPWPRTDVFLHLLSWHIPYSTCHSVFSTSSSVRVVNCTRSRSSVYLYFVSVKVHPTKA